MKGSEKTHDEVSVFYLIIQFVAQPMYKCNSCSFPVQLITANCYAPRGAIQVFLICVFGLMMLNVILDSFPKVKRKHQLTICWQLSFSVLRSFSEMSKNTSVTWLPLQHCNISESLIDFLLCVNWDKSLSIGVRQCKVIRYTILVSIDPLLPVKQINKYKYIYLWYLIFMFQFLKIIYL